MYFRACTENVIEDDLVLYNISESVNISLQDVACDIQVYVNTESEEPNESNTECRIDIQVYVFG